MAGLLVVGTAGECGDAVSTTHEYGHADQDHERFAVAVERDGFPSASEGEYGTEVGLVAALRRSRVALAPSPEASARMRAQVMEGAAALMAEQPAVAAFGSGAEEPGRAGGGRAEVVPLRRSPGRHRLAAAAHGVRGRGALTLGAAAALVVLAVPAAGALFNDRTPAQDSVESVARASEDADRAASRDGEQSRPAEPATTAGPSLGTAKPSTSARGGQIADRGPTHEASRSESPSGHDKGTRDAARDATRPVLDGLSKLAEEPSTDTVTGIAGRRDLPSR